VPEEKPQYPDLRTLEGAKQYLEYHSPKGEDIKKHEHVNEMFHVIVEQLWDTIPDGPGKTVFLRYLNFARMSANSCIANNGA
jgi:hypothetical protein